jgi:hypothetical protein
LGTWGTFLNSDSFHWERERFLKQIVIVIGAEGFAVFFLGGLLDLERNFASCDVTVTGQHLPAKDVGSL